MLRDCLLGFLRLRRFLIVISSSSLLLLLGELRGLLIVLLSSVLLLLMMILVYKAPLVALGGLLGVFRLDIPLRALAHALIVFYHH